jgi:hypothetical protein
MSENLYWQILDNLRAHLLGVKSLDEFEDWLVAQSWDAHKNSGPATLDLIGDLELRLAEFHGGHWDEAELQRFFLERVLAATYQTAESGSLSTTESLEVVVPLMGSPTAYRESLTAPA